MSRWLITGGAGYIGAHVVRAFLNAGHEVSVLDDLSTGHREFVNPLAHFVEGSIQDSSSVARALRGPDGKPVTGVVHCAGYKYAGESVSRPIHTYDVNVTGTLRLIEEMVATGVSLIVFSSSAAVYGTVSADRVTEATPTQPDSPYGETKLIGEWLMSDAQRAFGFRHTSLRYFNVIGSTDVALRDTSPHNLIPLVFEALRTGRTPQINGDSYSTPDGTCVRDYVDVADVAAAHVVAAARLETGQPVERTYNLGAGEGTSVRQIMDSIARVTGIDFTPTVAPPRAGDPARIVADGSLAARDLAWQQRLSLDATIASAWVAEQAAAG